MLFVKHPGIARHVMDAQELGLKDINFPLPLDKASTLDFFGKFTQNVQLLLKFIDHVDILDALSLRDDIDRSLISLSLNRVPPWGLHLVNIPHSTCDCGILKNTLIFERYWPKLFLLKPPPNN